MCILTVERFLCSISFYYEFSKELDYICTTSENSGMHYCGDFPPYRYGALVCNETAKPHSYNTPTNVSCVNWNQYYTNCTQRGSNPFQGTISFDNIGLAWVAIFLVSLYLRKIQHVDNFRMSGSNLLNFPGHIFRRLD